MVSRVGQDHHLLHQQKTIVPFQYSPYHSMPAVAGYTNLYNTNDIRYTSSLFLSPSYHLTGKQSHAYSTYNQKNNVICYFTNWATDRFGDGKYVPENVKSAAKYCTHIYYAYAKLDPITLELASSHVFTDETNGFFDRVVSVAKNSNPNVKVLLSMGGWTDSGTDKYSRLVADPNARANFAKKAAQTLKKHEFDKTITNKKMKIRRIEPTIAILSLKITRSTVGLASLISIFFFYKPAQERNRFLQKMTYLK